MSLSSADGSVLDHETSQLLTDPRNHEAASLEFESTISWQAEEFFSQRIAALGLRPGIDTLVTDGKIQESVLWPDAELVFYRQKVAGVPVSNLGYTVHRDRLTGRLLNVTGHTEKSVPVPAAATVSESAALATAKGASSRRHHHQCAGQARASADTDPLRPEDVQARVPLRPHRFGGLHRTPSGRRRDERSRSEFRRRTAERVRVGEHGQAGRGSASRPVAHHGRNTPARRGLHRPDDVRRHGVHERARRPIGVCVRHTRRGACLRCANGPPTGLHPAARRSNIQTS